MLSLINNMLALNADNQFRINSENRKKATEKLSSGYRINRAADDAAGLAISEKMRRQIRGLTQGTANAQDGVSFVQVADGSMNEVHDMLQRMNELAIQSMNGTCSDNDRAFLNAEFQQLRTEINRVGYCTNFNEQPVFEEHESSYYQLFGNKKWDPEQSHTVPTMANDLNIHLPDSYVPSDYTISVPPGIYSTLELMDEIDSALEMIKPSNPGFVFEYTEDGYCRLNFEGINGTPKQINSVDGALSYLLYDNRQGVSSASLLGTTVFDPGYPLDIKAGQNDELGFYLEKPGSTNYISMKISPGQYTRSDMIALINKELIGNPASAGVVAKEYGASSIQISGGDSVNITGLKGNMFKLENKPEIIYSSVFYDNVQYGKSEGTAASIRSYVSWYSSDKIYLSDTNNKLQLKTNNDADFREIILADAPGDYSLSDIMKTLNNNGVKAELVNSNGLPNNYSGYLSVSSPTKGSESSLVFNTADGTVSAAAYNALFCSKQSPPRTNYGQLAEIHGIDNLGNGTITLPANPSLTFQINDMAGNTQSYTINGLNQNYDNRTKLLADLNSHLQNDSSLASIKDNIKFLPYGSSAINIQAQTYNINDITFTANATYEQLFGKSVSANPLPSGSYGSKPGQVKSEQGLTGTRVTDAVAWVNIPNLPITIKNSFNNLSLSFRNTSDSSKAFSSNIYLNAGTYNDMNALVAEINRQFSPINNNFATNSSALITNISAAYEGLQLKFTFTPSSNAPEGDYSLSFNSSSIWGSIFGTKETDLTGSGGRKAYLKTTQQGIPAPVIIDSGNNSLTLMLKNDSSSPVVDYPLTIPQATYTRDGLKTALQTVINDNADLNGKVTVSLDSPQLKFDFNGYSINAKGSFYDKVLTTGSTPGNPPPRQMADIFIRMPLL